MRKVIITCEVENGTKWEKGFRTHQDLFRKQSSTTMDYSIDGNRVALYTEVKDLDQFKKVFESKSTAEAMAFDGVKRDTVKLHILDKDLPL